MEVPAPVLLVDGHNLLWRATFGFPAPVYSRDRCRELTGVFAFFALLRVAIRDHLDAAPEVVVVFDGENGSAARQATDGAYKASRPQDGQARRPLTYLPEVKRGLDVCGLPWVELDDAEADDVIATLVTGGGNREMFLLSADRDYYQLVTRRVRVLNTALRAGSRLVGPDEVETRHGVRPGQWPCFRALCGDPADNILGVRGVGQVTAARLLAGGLSLEDLPSSGRLTGVKGKAVLRAWDQVLAWRELIRMQTTLAVPHALSGVSSPPLPAPAEVIERLNLW